MNARIASLAVIAALFSLSPRTAHAQRCVAAGDRADDPGQDRYCGAPLITGLGGTAGFGGDMSCLRQNDDGSSPAIDVTPWFPMGLRFFTTTLHEQIFVNTNGNVTFSGPVSTYTPNPFPVADRPMIAPFWADVDIRPADGSCTEAAGTTCTSCAPCSPAESSQVWWHFEEGRAVFTWDEVGYFNCRTDRRQSFQVILSAVETCGAESGDFDVEFRYNRCEWDTGDASGGTGGFAVRRTPTRSCTVDRDCRSTGGPFGGPPGVCVGGLCQGIAAQAGFDAGNSVDFFEIMGSRVTRDINRRLCEESNVGEPGVWRFLVRRGAVTCPEAGMPCDTAMQGICGEGRISCECSGVSCTTSCVPSVEPRAERCNAIDDDCDGAVDETTDGAVCEPLRECIAGSCIATCFEGGCPSGFECTASGCVETACVGVECAAEERCRGGSCVLPCEGVVCPAPLACVAGACVDACAGISCDECSACDEGACVPRCDRAGTCPAGDACGADGVCVDADCVDVTCGAGTVCVAGGCVDACVGASCPEGEVCSAGACVPSDSPDAGPPVAWDGGPVLIVDAAAPFDAGVEGFWDGGPVRTGPGTGGGCCTVVGAGRDRGIVPLLLALVIGLAVRA
nr:hypothetical protein [Myxococcota bacterium]